MLLVGRRTRNREQRGATLIQNPGVPLTSTTLLSMFGPGQVDAGVTVSTETALGVASVWRAVSILSGIVASSPFQAFDVASGGSLVGFEAEDAGGTPATLMSRPHPLYTSYTFRELMMVHLLLWGNFYALKVQPKVGAGRPQDVQRLLPLMPWNVWPKIVVPKGDRYPTEKLFEVALPDGTHVGLDATEIFHVPGMGYDGVGGSSAISIHRQGLGLSIAAEKLGARFFGSGSMMSGFLHTDKKLTETAAKALKQRWQEKLSGVNHAMEVAVLDQGASFTNLTIAPDDAQFLQTRQFQVEEVARMFGIPAHLLEAGGASNWGTGIEQQNIGLVLFTVRPWMSRIEQQWSTELLPKGQVARFLTGEFTKGDTRVRYAAHLLARRAHTETINEIRRSEGLPEIDDPRANDVFYGAGEVGGVVGGDAEGDQLPGTPGPEGAATPGANTGNEAPPGSGEGKGDGTGDGTKINDG